MQTSHDDQFDTPEDISQFIGDLLLVTQDFEYLVGAALKVVFADKAEFTAETFFKKDKRSLGRLLKDLRSIVHIDKEVDNWLIKLVEERNIFIHHMRNQE